MKQLPRATEKQIARIGASFDTAAKRRDPRESAVLLGNAVKGKTVVFVVDDQYYDMALTMFEADVSETAGFGGNSKVMKYSEFFNLPSESFVADVLILRNSRLFELKFEALGQKLSDFRKANPNAAVLVCAFDVAVAANLLPSVDSGIINVVTATPLINDYELLLKGAEILSRRAGATTPEAASIP